MDNCYNQQEKPQFKSSAFGIISFALGLVGFLIGILIIGMLFDIITIAFGVIALIIKKQKKGLAIAGITLAASSIMCVALFLDIIRVRTESQEVASSIQSQEEKATYSVGETVEINCMEVTLVSCIENTGNEYNEPFAENIFVFSEFDIANNSD